MEGIPKWNLGTRKKTFKVLKTLKVERSATSLPDVVYPIGKCYIFNKNLVQFDFKINKGKTYSLTDLSVTLLHWGTFILYYKQSL
jgi:hypothetical protein